MSAGTVDLIPIDRLVRTIGRTRQQLVPLLHAIHDIYHYLPEEALRHLSEVTGLAPSAIYGVASFYNQFRFTPAGKHIIKVCVGTACHVKGAAALFDDIKKHLHIPDHEDTDQEGLFTVTKVACLGCCMLAPAVQIDDLTYGPVATQSIGHMLYDFMQSRTVSTTAPDNAVKPAGPVATVKLCLCSSCQAAGSQHIFADLQKRITREKLPVALKSVGCTGLSYETPLVEIETADHKTFRYGRVTEDAVERILAAHFKADTLMGKVRHQAYRWLENIVADEDYIPMTRYLAQVRDRHSDQYLSSQQQIATLHGGQLDPLDIAEYEAQQGFEALRRVRALDNPGEVIEWLEKSGLRGRGGAGFPTYLKWSDVRQNSEPEKYIVCNGDEGDPGAFMDRMLMESFPFRVLEGMAIAALACGIHKGFVFLRAEYPLAIERMQKAIECCKTQQLLGNLELELVVSAGAFVCGEETALIAAIEGRRGSPRYRPPYPSVRGLWNKPTLINNVETFASIPWIALNPVERFTALGTKTSPGTKTFALAGKIIRGGLIEVAMGTTLRDIVYTIGGGIKQDKKLKAVQIGGPAGGCLPAYKIDTPVDFDALKELGTIMGSGGMIVLDEDDCMVDIAHYFMNFTQSESCGKCTFCRIGTKRMLEILEQMIQRRGKPYQLNQLAALAHSVKAHSLCGLGRSAPNPLLSALTYFKEEFIAHTEGRCPAKKCKALVRYRITTKCIGCTKCAQQCPADAITMRPYQQQEIDQALCTKCDLCRQVCPHQAVIRE